MDHNPDNGRDTAKSGRNTRGTQDRQSSTKAASVQLGCDRQVFGVESLHVRGKNILSTYNMPEHDKIAIVKNWLGRKGLHYIESITEAENQACNTLQGLLDMVATTFWPQFNETIKLLV